MPVSAASGTLNTTTAVIGTAVSVTGLTFQPSLVLFAWSGRTAAGAGRGSHIRGFGAAVSSSSFWAVSSRSGDTAASADTNAANSETACVMVHGTAGTVEGAADLQSMNSDGFTLEILDAFPQDFLVHWLALGGDTVAKLGRFTATGTAPTTQAVNVDTGFTPTGVIFAASGIQSDPPANQVDSRFCVGAMAGATQEGVFAGGSNAGAATMNTSSYNYGGECIATLSGNLATVSDRAEFSSFDSNGFTVNWLKRAFSNRVYYVAIKGATVFVGNLLTQTDTVTAITETGVGFKPAALMVVSNAQAQSTQDTIQDHDRYSLGFATSASARSSLATHDEDARADAEVTVADSVSAVYQNIDTTDAVVGAMDIQSFDADGFTAIMDDADPSQMFAWYMAVGPAAAAGNPWPAYAQQ